MENLGKVLVGIGILLVVGGLILWLFSDKLGWLGHLPGDIRIERPGFTFYAPITTMILISIVLSVIVSVVSRLFR